jgi:hypothetical protein
MYPQDPFYDHTQLVTAVTNAGVPPPAEWTALRQRFDAYIALQFPLRQRLANALINGTDDDIAALKALAVAEQLAQAGSQASGDIEARVLHRLREIYAAVAADNYRAVAKQFDDAATRFADTAATVDVEADPASMIDKPDETRQAYLAAESFANQLTKLIPPLAAAATLATGTDIHPADQPAVLALVADTSGHKRRDVWAAFDQQTGRCGRWGALQRAGVPIHAASLAGLQPYRRPLPDDDAPIVPINPSRRTGRAITA